MNLMREARNLLSAVFLLLFVGLMAVIYTATAGGRDAYKEKTTAISDSYAFSRYAPYDTVPVSGSDVRTAFRAFAMDDYFFIYINHSGGLLVTNPSGINTQAPSINVSTSKTTDGGVAVNTTFDQIKDEASAKYIRPQSRWQSSLITDKNGTIIGVLFK